MGPRWCMVRVRCLEWAPDGAPLGVGLDLGSVNAVEDRGVYANLLGHGLFQAVNRETIFRSFVILCSQCGLRLHCPCDHRPRRTGRQYTTPGNTQR